LHYGIGDLLGIHENRYLRLIYRGEAAHNDRRNGGYN
jgi:hypothetical protein